VENWNGMKAAGIQQLGAYHYMRGAQTSDSQVKLIESCLKKVDFDPVKHFIAVDVELRYNEHVSAEKMADTLKGIIDMLRPKYKNIYIYAAPGFEHNVAWNKYKDDFKACNLWIAHHTSASQPRLLETWKDKGYILWQYSGTGKLHGFSKKDNFDMNRMKN
jgi:lysozyme